MALPATSDDTGFQRKPSMTDSSTRLSTLKCCKTPEPAPVRQTATRSPGCIWWLTNLRSDQRTNAMLSKERPRSSTISTIVRRTSSGRTCAEGGGGNPSTDLGEGFSRAALSSGDVFRPGATRTYAKWVNFCSFPSSKTWKSSGVRSVTWRPLESVTTASTCTSVEVTEKVAAGRGESGTGAAGCCPEANNAPITKTLAIAFMPPFLQIAALGGYGSTVPSVHWPAGPAGKRVRSLRGCPTPHSTQTVTVLLATPATVTITGAAPETPAGSATFTCHNPANPANNTSAGAPPTAAVTLAVTHDSGSALAAAPVGTGGETAPKPVPNRRMACRAAAGLSCELTE